MVKMRSVWLCICVTVAFAALHLSCATWTPQIVSNPLLAIHLRNVINVYVAEWLIYGILMMILYRRSIRGSDPRSDHAQTAHQAHQRAPCSLPPLWLLSMCLISLRVTWWPSPPSSSEDVWRYLWDGQRFYEGLSVFTEAPLTAQFDQGSLYSELLPKIGHSEVPTVYPPGAQLCFWAISALNHVFDGGLLGALLWWRALLLAFDLALLHALSVLCRRLSVSRICLVAYTLCPLCGLESSLGAHLDLIGVTLMMLSLALACYERWAWAGIALGLSISVKFVPIIIVFALLSTILPAQTPLNRLRPRRRSVAKLTLGCTAAILVTFSPFLRELSHLGGLWPGLNTYATHWTFNGSLYPIIEWGIRAILRVWTFEEPLHLRQGIKVCSALLICLIAWYLPRRSTQYAHGRDYHRHALNLNHRSVEHYIDQKLDLYSQQKLLQVCLVCISTFLLLSPVIYSWYLLWALPLATFVLGQHVTQPTSRVVFSLSALVWGALCVCTYLPRLRYLEDNIWYFSDLWLLMEYGTLGLTFVLATRYTLTSS